MVDVTPQMRLAMDHLAARGVAFYQVSTRTLGCGCIARQGWRTDTCEPAAGLESCSDAHAERFRAIQATWDSPSTVAKYGDHDVLDSIEEQMKEEG